MRIISLGGFAVFAQVDRVAARSVEFIFLSSFSSRSFSFLSICLPLSLSLSLECIRVICYARGQKYIRSGCSKVARWRFRTEAKAKGERETASVI